MSGTIISSTWANLTLSQIATGLSTAICKDGQQTVTANIPFASHKLTLVGNATLPTDAPNAAQVQNSALVYLNTVAGTNTITASFSGGVTPLAWAEGQEFSWIPAATNTGTSTIAPGSLAAKSIFSAGAACVGGEMVLGVPVRALYDGTRLNITSGTGSSIAVPPTTGAPLGNGYISVPAPVGGAITISLKATGGADATTSNPIAVILRNSSAANGTMTAFNVTAALSTVISSGSTLGCANSEKVRIHIGAMLNASTGIELFYWTASVAASPAIWKPNVWGFVTTTAEGGSGGADSSQTPYSTTARTSQPWRYLGYIEATSGATAGQWASINNIVNWLPGIALPGDVVGTQFVPFGSASDSDGTVLPGDSSIPQVSEGYEFMTTSYLPQSSINVIETTAQFNGSPATSAGINGGLFKNGGTNAVAAASTNALVGTSLGTSNMSYTKQAGTTSPLVMSARYGCNTVIVVTFNGASGGVIYGGVMNSYIKNTEYQG